MKKIAENSESTSGDHYAALCILVVDDNQASANTLAELLEMFGHKVRIAYDGANALATALDYLPDVIILDLNLPGLDGFELCRIMRSEHGFDRTMFIAHTGYKDEAYRKRALHAGFAHFLLKPVAITELIHLLNSYARAQKQPALEY